MADGSQMDEQVQHRFVRDGYAILPAGSVPVGLAEAAQAHHNTALLVQVAPPAWAGGNRTASRVSSNSAN